MPQPAGTAASALLKRYRPLETRAAGGFGSVEICLDGRLQRRVAIKRMPLASPYTRAAAETTRTALAEARTASMLQHPNIVSVIDFTYDAGYAYLVMEYVDGMSLEEFLSQVEGNSLTYDEAACIADALVQAVAYAHENGVLHLDIKPANVLIDRSGHVKITDFGMATLTSAAGFGGARGGTIGYMPPEQLRGDYVDERSDIFSLACVLYESLCGDAPFRAGSPIDSMTRINEGVVLPGTLLPDLPELAEQALLSALDPDPAMRISSVLDFGDRFLYNLGNPREGRKSLARMIDQLTSDEEESQDENSLAPRRTWELDPAEGHLGSRDPRARRIAMGLVAGASVAAVTFSFMQTAGVANPLACLLSAVAVGAAAGAAPQMGSALALAGLVFTVASATASLAGIPTIVLIFALAAAWWLVWGRTVPAASMALAACMALSVVASSPSALAPVAAAAGYLPLAGHRRGLDRSWHRALRPHARRVPRRGPTSYRRRLCGPSRAGHADGHRGRRSPISGYLACAPPRLESIPRFPRNRRICAGIRAAARRFPRAAVSCAPYGNCQLVNGAGPNSGGERRAFLYNRLDMCIHTWL